MSKLPESMKAIVAYAPGDYKLETIPVPMPKEGEILIENIPVKGGTEPFVSLAAKNSAVLLLRQNETYEVRRSVPETLYAPLASDAVVGTLEYLDREGNLIAVVELVPHKDMAQAGLGDFIRLLFLGFLHA